MTHLIPNLQVDKIMIRKKRTKSNKVMLADAYLRNQLRESQDSKNEID